MKMSISMKMNTNCLQEIIHVKFTKSKNSAFICEKWFGFLNKEKLTGAGE